MRHFLTEWGRSIRGTIKGSIYLFLDFDGTLTQIRPHPAEVFIDVAVKNMLEELSRTPGISIAVISGRALSDVEERVGVKGLVYAGNHGLEIKGIKDMAIPGEAAEAKKDIKYAANILRKELSAVEGIYIEDKGITLSVHYRGVAEGLEGEVLRKALFAISPLTDAGKIKVTRGKKVLEVRPPMEWDKGKAVKSILEKSGEGSVPVYIGDDTTDEDAFRELKGKGFCVKVTDDITEESAAEYYLKDISEVEEFLHELRSFAVKRKGG